MPDPDLILYVLEAMAAQITAQRRLGAKPTPCAIRFLINTDNVERILTLTIDDTATIHDSDFTPPGLPRATLRLPAEDLLELLRGKRTAEDLLETGHLRVAGRVDLLASVAACFPANKNWLSVRM